MAGWLSIVAEKKRETVLNMQKGKAKESEEMT